MTDIYEWLENANQPMNELFIDDPMNQIMPLDIDKDGNVYFDMPHAWNVSFEQSPINVEPFPIDPSLYTTTNPSASTTFGRIIVMVLEEFAEASSKILIYFAKILDIPEISKDVDEESTEGMIFTTEELEALEPIDERSFEPAIPSIINDICVNANPQAIEIEYIIDLRRIRLDRLTFYLAKTIKGNYYWFHTSHADRDRSLRKLIEDFRHESQEKNIDRKR